MILAERYGFSSVKNAARRLVSSLMSPAWSKVCADRMVALS